MRLLLGLVAFCLLCAPDLSYAQLSHDSFDWVLRRDRNGISVYTATVEGSPYKAVSTSMVLAARADSVAALIMDLKRCEQWVPLCKVAELYQTISPQKSYVYNRNDLPFPLRDRDVLAYVQWFRNPESGAITMESHAKPELMAKNKGVVRLTQARSEWSLTPLNDGNVLVESFVHVNPNGPIPAWIINKLIIGTPYKTMRNLRAIIKQGDYAEAQLAF